MSKIIKIDKTIKCECGGEGILYNIFLKDDKILGLQYDCSYYCGKDLDKFKEIKIEKEIKCSCGSDAIFERVSLIGSDIDKQYLSVHYWCYHTCDTLTEKIIKFDIR